jgi:tetratricopeptide (TPR) repeat protein
MHAYLAHSSFGYMRADLAAELARRQAEIVQSHSLNSPSVNQALGWIHFHHDRDFAAASTAFARPQPVGYSPWSTLYRLRFALAQGRFAEAFSLLHEALESDPYSPVMHGRLTWALHLSGDMSAALEQAKRSLALFPDRPSATFFSAIVFAAAGNTNGQASSSYAAQATEVATRLVQSSPSLDPGVATLAYAQARQGRTTEARALLDRQQWLSRERFVMSSFQAPALVELGEFDAAIEALTIADEQHCPWLFELLSDPRLKPLHGEPVFERLRNLTRDAVPLGASVA